MSNDNKYTAYESPFCTRYASKEMQYLFSAEKKFTTWRKLWIALAKAEQKLGLDISDTQIAELEKYANNVNFSVAEANEKETRHDVMAHVLAYGEQAQSAKGIIHLGATSCYVGDNTDIIVMREALDLVLSKITGVMSNLASFALEYKALPCLAYTHLQPAQLTTVGKRACLWLNELLMDYSEVLYRRDSLALLGSKGTTGTQASFLELFGGNHQKVKELERLIAADLGFTGVVPVSGQTYSRKVDMQVCNALAGIATTASKFSCDIRLLQSFKELEEPFEKTQIGSSAMAYKRNPMRSERITALSRYVLASSLNPALTASVQWFERTLDDSANKRIAMAESFLAVDAILNLMLNVTDGMVVYPEVVRARVMAELPFMATENILMSAVKAGGDRQALHEKIRQKSMIAAENVKKHGQSNNLCELLCEDTAFNISESDLEKILEPSNFIGMSAEQVDEFIFECIQPILQSLGGEKISAEISV
jgi:adenylosuccinate lyase